MAPEAPPVADPLERPKLSVPPALMVIVPVPVADEVSVGFDTLKMPPLEIVVPPL